MADVGSRVIGPVALAAAAATLYTVPGSTTLTIRNIHINNETAAAVNAALSIGTDGAGKRLFGPSMSIPANSSFDWSGFIVVSAAEIITGWAGSAAALTIAVSGVLTT